MTLAEWTELVEKIVVPLAIALLGFVLGISLKRSEALITKRLQLLDMVAKPLNDVYCYLITVGGWKESTPRDIVACKRTLDAQMFPHVYLFKPKVLKRYIVFMDLAFKTWSGHGRDAKLRANVEKYRSVYKQWSQEWEPLFAASDWSSKDEIHRAYWRLLHTLARSTGVWFPPKPKLPKAPANSTPVDSKSADPTPADPTPAAPAVAEVAATDILGQGKFHAVCELRAVPAEVAATDVVAPQPSPSSTSEER